MIGTPGYVGPEVVLGLPYDQAVDVWSLGVVMFMLYTKKVPFVHNDLDEAYPEVTPHYNGPYYNGRMIDHDRCLSMLSTNYFE